MAETPDKTLARLRRQLAALDKAMGSGVLTVEGPDTGRVTYRTYAEMRSARSDLLRQIGGADAQVAGTPARRRTRRVVMIGTSGL